MGENIKSCPDQVNHYVVPAPANDISETGRLPMKKSAPRSIVLSSISGPLTWGSVEAYLRLLRARGPSSKPTYRVDWHGPTQPTT